MGALAPLTASVILHISVVDMLSVCPAGMYCLGVMHWGTSHAQEPTSVSGPSARRRYALAHLDELLLMHQASIAAFSPMQTSSMLDL